MNQYFSLWRAGLVLAALLLAPVLASAQSPYEGIYFGTYQGPADDGEFALIVNDSGYGTLASFDALDDRGYIENDIHIRSDGSFQFVTTRGVRIDGQATASGISGRYFADGTGGNFTGLRAPDEGPLQDAAGYYSGPASITVPGTDIVINSRLVAIVAADGSAFFLLDHAFPWHAGAWPDSFDFGFTSPFPWPVGLWPGNLSFGLDLGFGFGFDLSFDLGFGYNPAYPPGSGFCGPFNFGLDYSFQMSFLGALDLDFNLPTCRSSWAWDHFPAPVENSGGMVQIAPGGEIQGTLLDGLVLQGLFDPKTNSAEGILFQSDGNTNWTGEWVIDRQYGTRGFYATGLYRRLPDVNSDGSADIAWHHAVTGENAVWLMDGADVKAISPLENELDQQWTLALVDDLDDDQQVDFTWRHPVSGENFVSLSGDAAAAFFELDPAWKIVGVGDFDADARPGILVRHSDTGDNAVLADLSGQPVLVPFPVMEEQSWSSVAVADFDGDSYPDVLWVNRYTSELLIWLMNVQAPDKMRYLDAGDSGQYALAAVGDFDGDGATDILWRDYATGAAIITMMAGGDGATDIQLGANVPREWQLGGVGDLDGDGTDDLLWRNGLTGENIAWRVVDAQVADTFTLMPVPDLHWRIQP
jgi:hypothetical protein